MAKRNFQALIEKAKKRDSYWIGKVIQDFTEDLYRLMEQRDISKTELARRIGSSPAYVTKVLRGDTNFTVETMVRLSRAVGGELCVHVGQQEGSVRWFDVIQQLDAIQQENVAIKPRGEYTTVAEDVVVLAPEMGIDQNESAVSA